MLLSVKSTGQELDSAATESLQLAGQAASRAGSEQAVTGSEIQNLETKISTLSSSLQNTNADMKQRLADERRARRAGLVQEKRSLTSSAGSVLDQLQFVSDILSQAAARSLEKQKLISGRVETLRATIQQHIDGARAAHAAALAQIAERQQGIEADLAQDRSWVKAMAGYRKEMRMMQTHLSALGAELARSPNGASGEAEARLSADTAEVERHLAAQASTKAQRYSTTA